MVITKQIMNILLRHHHKGDKVRHTVIAYTYIGKQLQYAVNSYSCCCSTSKKAGHYYDHAETKLLQQLQQIPKTIYVYGITQGKRVMQNTMPCKKCTMRLQTVGVKRVICLYQNYITTIKLQ